MMCMRRENGDLYARIGKRGRHAPLKGGPAGDLTLLGRSSVFFRHDELESAFASQRVTLLQSLSLRNILVLLVVRQVLQVGERRVVALRYRLRRPHGEVRGFAFVAGDNEGVAAEAPEAVVVDVGGDGWRIGALAETVAAAGYRRASSLLLLELLSRGGEGAVFGSGGDGGSAG